MTLNLPLYYLIPAVAVVLLIIFFAVRLVKRRYFLETLKLRTLLVRIPQKEPNEEIKREPLKEVNFMSQLLSELAGLKIPFSLEVAVHHVGQEIHFYIAVPANSTEFAMRQIQGLWNDASIEMVDDYNIFNSE